MKMLAAFAIAAFAALNIPATGAEPDTARGRLAIVAPLQKQVLLANGGDVVVSLAADPPLAEGEQIVVRVDGQVVVLPSGATRFELSDVPDGPHVIEAVLIDGDANPVASAPPVQFHVRFGYRI
jgi:hypothetical protein